MSQIEGSKAILPYIGTTQQLFEGGTQWENREEMYVGRFKKFLRTLLWYSETIVLK